MDFRNEGLTCQMKTEMIPRVSSSEWSFWHVVFFLSTRLMEGILTIEEQLSEETLTG